MAKAYAYAAFDYTKINFYSINAAAGYMEEKDEFAAYYDSGYEEHFYGEKLTYDKNGMLTGGKITGYEAVYGGSVFYLGGFSVAATALEKAMDSVSTADDMKLLAAMFKGADTLTGSSYADRINGFAGKDLIDGKKGDDILTGGAGKDTFIFTSKSGHDTITDFEARDTHANHDRIDLHSFSNIDSFSDLKPLMSQHGHDVLIDFGKAELTLEDVKHSQLGKGDFLF
jgi:Ca2+-binding RTX toxin-like protein